MSNERRNPTTREKEIAWENITGIHPDPSKVYSTAKCPYKNCQYRSSAMDWSNYGDQSNISWVVDHIKPLARDGTWDRNNLQAMHNYCNNLKGDSY